MWAGGGLSSRALGAAGAGARARGRGSASDRSFISRDRARGIGGPRPVNRLRRASPSRPRASASSSCVCERTRLLRGKEATCCFRRTRSEPRRGDAGRSWRSACLASLRILTRSVRRWVPVCCATAGPTPAAHRHRSREAGLRCVYRYVSDTKSRHMSPLTSRESADRLSRVSGDEGSGPGPPCSCLACGQARWLPDRAAFPAVHPQVHSPSYWRVQVPGGPKTKAR